MSSRKPLLDKTRTLKTQKISDLNKNFKQGKQSEICNTCEKTSKHGSYKYDDDCDIIFLCDDCFMDEVIGKM